MCQLKEVRGQNAEVFHVPSPHPRLIDRLLTWVFCEFQSPIPVCLSRGEVSAQISGCKVLFNFSQSFVDVKGTR